MPLAKQCQCVRPEPERHAYTIRTWRIEVRNCRKCGLVIMRPHKMRLRLVKDDGGETHAR